MRCMLHLPPQTVLLATPPPFPPTTLPQTFASFLTSDFPSSFPLRCTFVVFWQLASAEGASAQELAHARDRLSGLEQQLRDRDAALHIAQERMEEARQRVAFAEHSAHDVRGVWCVRSLR